MTGAIFERWDRKLDKKFKVSDQRAPLIVDNCSALKVGIEPRIIKLALLPPNMTAVLYLANRGVVKNKKSP